MLGAIRDEYSDSLLVKYPNLRTIFLSKTISIFGFWFTLFALYSEFIFRTNVGPLAVGTLAIISFLPRALNPVLAVIVDRFDRRNVLVVAEVASGVLVVGLFLFHSLYLAYAILLGVGLFTTLVKPAQRALLPQIVSENELDKANGIISTTGSTGQIVGPMVAGLLLTVVTPNVLYLLDAASFFVAAGLLVRMRSYGVAATGSSFGSNVVDGLRYFFTTRSVLVIATIGGGSLAVFGTLDALVPFYFREVIGLDVSAYGVLTAVVGGGNLSGHLFISRFGFKRDRTKQTTLWTGVSGVSIAVLALVPDFLTILAASFVIGVAGSFILVEVDVTVQEVCPDEKLGHVLGTTNGLEQVMMLLGMVVSSSITKFVSVQTTFLLTAAGVSLLSIPGYDIYRRRVTDSG